MGRRGLEASDGWCSAALSQQIAFAELVAGRNTVSGL